MDYRITAPTLVIAGDQDARISALLARRMAEAIPDSEFVLLPGCGHNAFAEKPDVVVPIVTEFLMPSRNTTPPPIKNPQQAMEATV